MPIYEYQCQSCNHHFEKLQKISDEPLIDCPDCAKPTLRKMVSASAFRLKGSGWYETDFKTGNKKNLNAGSEDSPKTPAAPSATATSTSTSATSGDTGPATASKESSSKTGSNGGNNKGNVKSSTA